MFLNLAFREDKQVVSPNYAKFSGKNTDLQCKLATKNNKRTEIVKGKKKKQKKKFNKIKSQ